MYGFGSGRPAPFGSSERQMGGGKKKKGGGSGGFGGGGFDNRGGGGGGGGGGVPGSGQIDYGKWANETGKKAGDKRREIRRRAEKQMGLAAGSLSDMAGQHQAQSANRGGGGGGGGGGGKKGKKGNKAINRACQARDVFGGLQAMREVRE